MPDFEDLNIDEKVIAEMSHQELLALLELAVRLLKIQPDRVPTPDLIVLLQLVWASKDANLAEPFIVELMNRFRPLLSWHHRRLSDFGIDRHEFENDVLFKLYKSLNSIKDPEKFTAFFCAVTMSVARDLTRKSLEERRRYTSLDAQEGPASLDHLESTLQKAQEGMVIDLADKLMLEDELRYLLRDGGPLSLRERQVLERHLEEKSDQEIADELEITTVNVRNILCRTRRKIRWFLSGEGR